jgi:tellurite methyltransferase
MSSPPNASRPGPAWLAARDRDWPAYFDRMRGKPPRDTLVWALDAFEDEPAPDARHAIDLGCGQGRDAIELLDRGWSVLAIDGHPEGLRLLLNQPSLVATPRLTLRLATFEDPGDLPDSHLINASFSLPFCPPEFFPSLWARVRAALLPGGRFAGQLFGDRDTWATLADRTHHTRAEATALLDGWNIERFEEDERDAEDAEGNQKHWHVFHIVARRSV